MLCRVLEIAPKHKEMPKEMPKETKKEMHKTQSRHAMRLCISNMHALA